MCNAVCRVKQRFFHTLMVSMASDALVVFTRCVPFIFLVPYCTVTLRFRALLSASISLFGLFEHCCMCTWIRLLVGACIHMGEFATLILARPAVALATRLTTEVSS